MSPGTRILYLSYCGVAVSLLKEFNNAVTESYMVSVSHLQKYHCPADPRGGDW
jgi:alpha-1,2-glucosyltransferase